MTLYKVWFGKKSPDFYIIINDNDSEKDLWGLIGSQYPEYYD